MTVYKGKVWRFGDHVDTDQIIPAERLVSENLKRLGDFAFEKVRPGIAEKMQKGDIIIAERNFGCGSSREHAPLALIDAGISCVVAGSFSRIFFRNSINTGLALVECNVDIQEGSEIEVDTSAGTIKDLSNGRVYNFKKHPEFIRELIESGGLIETIRRRK